MIVLRQVALPFALGCALYVAAFMFVLEKPLTVGINRDYFAVKDAYLSASRGQQKLVLFAGSNGRFSHRCQTIELVTGTRCVNMSVAAGSSFRWQVWRFKDALSPGDVVYLPLEYKTLGLATQRVGAEAPYVVRYDRAGLATYNLSELAWALFSFDLRFLGASIGETVLTALGKSRRFSAGTLTPNGDESGHTFDASAPYRSRLDVEQLPAVDQRVYSETSYWNEEIEFLRWASRHGIVVVGGLPTVPEDAAVPANAERFMREMFEGEGHCFLALPNGSRYPRQAFFDTVYHLTEEVQIRHSREVARLLQPIIKQRGCL